MAKAPSVPKVSSAPKTSAPPKLGGPVASGGTQQEVPETARGWLETARRNTAAGTQKRGKMTNKEFVAEMQKKALFDQLSEGTKKAQEELEKATKGKT